jgi:hypothetical protein
MLSSAQSGRGQRSPIGQAETERGVGTQITLPLSPGKAAGEQDSRLVDGAGTLSCFGHGGQWLLEETSGELVWR